MRPDEIDQIRGEPPKARPRGTLPYLPRDREPEPLLAWVTAAFRPAKGWRVTGFERTGREPEDPCTVKLMNGRESRVYRFRAQKDLHKTPRVTITSVTDGWLNVPHLTGSEIEDLWQALCTLGQVLTEHDERDETRKWIEQMIIATLPMTGYTLVPDARHDALMAIKAQREFTKTDALSLVRPSGNGDEQYQQRPIRFVDKQTAEQWLRAGEAATFVRWVVGVEPMSHGTLRARLHEIGVTGRRFEDHRPPHPKLNLYQLTDELIEGIK